MADMMSGSAAGALNEQDYINKLYDNNLNKEKDLIQENFRDNNGLLDQEQNRVQQQTQEYVNRTRVEAQRDRNQYTGPRLTTGAGQQEALVRENAQRRNVGDLNRQEDALNAEIERQRQLMASQFEKAIKQAQAENNMERAQQLYAAARNEEAKLLELRKQAAAMMSQKGDKSIWEELMQGKTPTADYSGDTWGQVLKNEGTLNTAYDSQVEALRLGAQSEYEKAISDLLAKQRQEQANTDRKLTDSYVDGLKKQKNYAEVQSTYGQGSGTAGAARIAQDTELQDTLTALRLGQMGTDGKYGSDRLGMGMDYGEKLRGSVGEVNRKRAQALLDAAENEEANLLDIQLAYGQELAKKKDYSVLGQLYGLTRDQIDRLQGTGKYRKRDAGGGSSSTGSKKNPPKDDKPYYDELANPEKTRWGTK